MIVPKEPKIDFLGGFFASSLLATKTYAIDVINVPNKLDQNEVPYDWPEDLKERVLKRLAKMPWNRYPAPFADEVTAAIAGYAGVDPACVLTAPGTNLLISIIIDVMTRALKGKIIIAKPTFPLYESQCAVEGLSYSLWPLNEDLDYDLSLLPEVPKGSIIMFASPNNPVGNALKKKDLRTLLETHPHSMILADEAYFEFADETYTDLLKDFDNLLIVRTCSKTLGSAGLRLGYSLASKALTAELKKARLPYLLNHFTIAAATEVLQKDFLNNVLPQRVEEVRSERTRVYKRLSELSKQKNFFVKDSQANFFLVRWSSQERCAKAYKDLIAEGILVRNISGGKGLEGCLRISLGTVEQNDILLKAAAKVF